MRQGAHQQKRSVGQNRDKGQKHARSNSHQQIIGRKAPKMRNRFDKMVSIGEKHLVKALGPAHALLPGGCKGNGLLIKELSRRITDAYPVDRTERRELDVFGQGMKIPAVHAFHDLGRDQVSRTRNGARGTAHHARVVEKTGLAQKPSGIGG